MKPPLGGTKIGLGVAGLGIGLAGLVAGPLSPLATEHAFAECNPHRSNDGNTYVDGWSAYKPTALYDVAANIKVVDTWVYTPSDVGSWTMLWNGASPPAWRWAQILWREHSGNSRYYTTEYTDNSGVAWDYSDPNIHPSVGATPHLKTEYDPAYTKFNFYVDSTTFPSTPSVSWVPTYAKIASETHTLASQMPGTSSDKEHYTNSVLKVAGNWVAFNGYYDNPNYFSHLLILDTQSADVYDNCS
jgi:hypothetical protein